MSETAVLSLGSNLGDREANLRAAVADIAALRAVWVDATSGLVETAAVKPAGVDESAPSYLNAIVRVTTDLSADELLAALGAIELAHGRVREVRWGDRTLDVDIITYGDTQREDPALTLPHPRAAERAFVLVPWLELDPARRTARYRQNRCASGGLRECGTLPCGGPFVKRTRPFFLVLLAVLGAGAGLLLQVILGSLGAAAASAPFTLALSLAVIGILVVVFAVPVRRAVRDREKHRVDPFYATRVVVLAKASSIAGSLLLGATASILGFLLSRAVVAAVGSIFTSGAAVVGAVILLVCGLVAENMCSLPPDDEDKGEKILAPERSH